MQEWRHAHGMRCLGIPNTAHFANVTLIADALARKLCFYFIFKVHVICKYSANFNIRHSVIFQMKEYKCFDQIVVTELMITAGHRTKSGQN